MLLQVLLLLTLLDSGGSLQPWEVWEERSVLLARDRRQVEEDLEPDTYEDMGTDPPETFSTNSSEPVPPTSKFLAEMVTVGQKDSGSPEPATPQAATGDSVGLDATRMAVGNLSVEVATQGVPVTLGPLSEGQVTASPPITEAPSTEGPPSTELATTEALSTEPAATEVLTTRPAATEALSTGPAATEVLTTQPSATEALSTGPAATEVLTTRPAATDALSTGPAATEAPTTQPAATDALATGPETTDALSTSTEPTATEALSTGPETTDTPSTSTEPTATEAPSTGPETTDTLSTSTEPTATGPTTTGNLTLALFVPSGPHNSTTMAADNSSEGFVKRWKNSQSLSPKSSVAPSPTEAPDRVPVKQCLLAILILALVATVFLVCTVVLAVRLSRRNHMYPVRSYSPTEMVCISSLLPEGGDAPPATANGDLPKAKGQGLKVGPGEGREGDDLTLQSFLP